NEVADGVRVLGELPDREERAADRDRVHHRVHARSVGQPGVDHRRAFVDATTHLAHDLVDGPAQVTLVDELDVGFLDPASTLDVHRLRSVDHDLGDAGVLQVPVDRPVAHRVVGDVLDELRPLGGRE